MKYVVKAILSVCCAMAVSRGVGHTLAAEFVHPGIAHNQAELAFVRSKLQAEQQPWQESWEKMRSSREASLSWTPDPRAHVERGAYNRPDVGASDFLNDGRAAYTHALLWAFTEKVAHARKAAEILNAWSATLESISKHDAKLLVGMGGLQFCNSAELLKHTWDGWSAGDQQAFRDMSRNVLYPVIQDFFPRANGNWDASMVQTMMAMGVFLDDHVMFQKAVDYYRNGVGNGAVNHYFNEFGQCQESGRDQAHTQMGLEYLVNSAEIAWKQGVDLYSAYDNRLAKGFEYTAKFNLGYDVPFEYFESYRGKYKHSRISDKSRGRLRPMYDKVVNHYHNRMGMDMPWSTKALEKTRPETGGTMPWSTLMYADQPADLVACRITAGAQTEAAATNSPRSDAASPVVLGRGVGLFKIGPLMAEDNFENLDNWVVQIQERSGYPPANVEARDRSLDCLLPGRGCTAWYRKKFPTRVTITYNVLCPTPKPAIKGAEPRDINNFWMATDPDDPDNGLFESDRYTGAFSSYDKMHGYYASTGGAANQTTRMRRYPREVDGRPAEHIALSDRDGQPGYLITPDKVMTVQLVAYDDVVQYIVDGKLNYQIARGDPINVEGRDSQGKRVTQKAVYDLKRFPFYREGYFGFRMVGTHHIYTNFRVYVLQPDDNAK